MQDEQTSRVCRSSDHGDHSLFWWAVWCVLGISVPVTLNISGISIVWSEGLKQWLIQPPFNMMERAFVPAPLALFCFGVGVTMFFTWAVIHLDSLLHRILVIAAGAVSLLLFIPVCALWQVFFNTIGTSLAMLTAGLGASITCLILNRKNSEPSSLEDNEVS